MDSTYGRGGVTSNEDVLRFFCTNSTEVKANNLSTHYDSYNDEVLLRQYGTLIAKRKGDKVMITAKRYSVTTSKVQNELLRLAMEYGLDVQKTNEFAKGGMSRKCEVGDNVFVKSKGLSGLVSRVNGENCYVKFPGNLSKHDGNYNTNDLKIEESYLFMDEYAKGGKMKSLNDGLEVYAENDLQLKVIQDIIPILDKKGIKLRFAVKVGKLPQSIIFDNHYRDSALVIPGKGYESEYLPVWYDNEFQDANEFENLETNPSPYLPNLDDRDEYAKGGKMKSLNDGLEVYAENDLQLKVIQDIIPILDKKGIKLRFAVKVGKFPQSIIFDNHYRDSALVIPGKGYESEYLPVWYDNEFQDANEFENLETNPSPYLPNLDDRDEYAKGGKTKVQKNKILTTIEKQQYLKLIAAEGRAYDNLMDLENNCHDDHYRLEDKISGAHNNLEKFIHKMYKKYGDEIEREINTDIYAQGGNVQHHKLSTSLKSKLKSANNILKRYGGREISEHEAIMWNVFHNATSGFEAGYEAFDVAGANNYHNATTREHETIGDNLIDISRAMIGVDYDDYNFRGTKEENENYYLMNYKNQKFSKGGDIAQGNYEMMLSQAKEVEHHVEELQNILKGEKDIDAWVVAKMENVSSTLSDITHYLDGKTEYAHGGKMSRGGYFGKDALVKDLSEEFASEELLAKFRKKSGIKDTQLTKPNVIAFAYTDYGGNFMDKVAIEYFLENHPKNIVVEKSAYNGQNAIVFGKVAMDWVQATEDYPYGFEDFETFYYDKVYKEEEQAFSEYLYELQGSDTRGFSRFGSYELDYDEVLQWLLENKGGYYSLTTQGLDFYADDLTKELLEEGLIEKSEEYAKGGEVKELKRGDIITLKNDIKATYENYIIPKGTQLILRATPPKIYGNGWYVFAQTPDRKYEVHIPKENFVEQIKKLPEEYAKGGMVGAYSVVLEADDIKNSSFLNYLKRNGIKHEILSVQYQTAEVKFIGSKEALTKMIDKFWVDMEESEMQEMYDSIQKNEYAKGGNINSKTNKKMATKKVKDGQAAPQTKRWIFAFNKGGYNYYNTKEVPYKKPVDADKKGAPVGYRFSKFAEEKGITNNRFRKPTKSEVEQYAGKKKNGKLIMYRETRSNKSDVNPKKRI